MAFRDGETAHELITAIAEQERLASIEIVLRDGDRLAVVRQAAAPATGGGGCSAWRLPPWCAGDGQDPAEVRVRSDASVFERVLGGYLLGWWVPWRSRRRWWWCSRGGWSVNWATS